MQVPPLGELTLEGENLQSEISCTVTMVAITEVMYSLILTLVSSNHQPLKGAQFEL